VLVDVGSSGSDDDVQESAEQLRIDLKDLAHICASLSPPLHPATGEGGGGGCGGLQRDMAVDRLGQVLLIARDQGLLHGAGGGGSDSTACTAELRALVAPLPQLLHLLFPP